MTRVVLVTGANRGIGRELARQLALRGDLGDGGRVGDIQASGQHALVAG